MSMSSAGVHKQVVNRLIEPFLHTTVLVTATARAYRHFFALRCHPAAQPEMRRAAEAMRAAYDASTPRPLEYGEWHTPYILNEDLVAMHEKYGSRNLYSVHEIQSGGVTVREYVSSSGLVFGLAWNGRVHPELGALLGSYKAEYQDGLKASPRKKGQRAHAVRGARVVVEKWGHMRNLKGRAYDPALLPAGVKADEIK
jgi:nitroreductase